MVIVPLVEFQKLQTEGLYPETLLPSGLLTLPSTHAEGCHEPALPSELAVVCQA